MAHGDPDQIFWYRTFSMKNIKKVQDLEIHRKNSSFNLTLPNVFCVAAADSVRTCCKWHCRKATFSENSYSLRSTRSKVMEPQEVRLNGFAETASFYESRGHYGFIKRS